jgi:hypothetical protein
MKQILAIAALGLSLSGCMTLDQWSEAPTGPAPFGAAPPAEWWGRDVPSVAVFDQALAAHGNWATHNRFGRIFLPTGVAPDWQPYTRGQWVQDPRFGPMFVSADPWGWATYHYGRWGRDARFGWYWIPDTRFAPSPGAALHADGQGGWNRWSGGWGSQWGGWGGNRGPGWNGGWGPGWGPGWNAGWGPGWNAGWGAGWNRGWGGGWGGWHGRDWRHQGWHDRDRRRDRDPIDRTRPGDSPMAGFVRNRVQPDAAPDREPRPAMLAPRRAVPADAAVSAPTYADRAPVATQRVERAAPVYQRADTPRASRSPLNGRDTAARVIRRMAED